MNSITKLIMTVVIGIVLVVGVMIPLLTGLDDNVKSVEQNSTQRFFVDDDDLDLVIECPEIGKYVINGKNFDGSSDLMVIGNGLYIYLYSSNYSIIDLQNDTVSLVTTAGTVIEIVDGSFTHGAYTGQVDTLLYPDERGNYGAFIKSDIRVDKDDSFYLISNRSGGLPKFVLTVENGQEVRSDALIEPITTSGTTYTEYTETLNIELGATETEDGLGYTYTGISVTAGETIIDPLVYAPIKYHVIDSTAETVKTIMGILPILVLISLLVIAGYAVMASIGNKTDI